MSGLSSFLSSAIEKFLFHPMMVTESEVIGSRFRLIRMQGEKFKGVRWTPGQAVQIYLGNLTKRAYTPMDLDPEAGSARFLFYLHGGGPGSAWAATLKTGDICQVMRPKDSLDFTAFKEPVLFFGDETSLAAAQAFHRCTKNALRFLLEVTSPPEVEIATAKLGLENIALFEKTHDGSHLEKIVTRLVEDASTLGSPQWVFTGQARSIQSIRKRLRAAGIEPSNSKVRAYWSPGKTGMD
ncbi:siderophore-interacting protein [Granulicella sp. S156]|uniref:siderophore-interacting protein n=1 Tax=Granulicella sp. S156 TaxID=1747224 RepID=UPI00131C8A7F|nr:siderophore-interacting protein [Granulicella sp. S156]